MIQTTIRVHAGRQLVGTGASTECFGLIRTGRARVTVGGTEVAQLAPGDWFGGNGLLRRALDSAGEHGAEIHADTALEVALLRRTEFFEALDARPDFARRVIQQARHKKWA